MAGFCSDRAATMTGVKSGVAARLKAVPTHCCDTLCSAPHRARHERHYKEQPGTASNGLQTTTGAQSLQPQQQATVRVGGFCKGLWHHPAQIPHLQCHTLVQPAAVRGGADQQPSEAHHLLGTCHPQVQLQTALAGWGGNT